MDVCSPSATTPFLDRQYSHDVVRSHEPPVAERHHADVGSPRNVFFAHVHIVANVCSIQRYRQRRVHPCQPDCPYTGSSRWTWVRMTRAFPTLRNASGDGAPAAIGLAVRQAGRFDRSAVSLRDGLVAAIPVVVLLAGGGAGGGPRRPVTGGGGG